MLKIKMTPKKYSVSKGFSLLEIMLVIVVIGIIAIYAASSLHSEVKDKAVAKSATEMQYWLQAASAYYVNKSTWPSNLSELYQGTDPYFPRSQVCSPWHISTPSSDPTCVERGEYIGAPASSKRYWTLKVKVPTQEIAMRLVSQLHSATVKNGTTVIASIPKPAATINTENQLLIKSIYELPVPSNNPDSSGNGAKVTLPSDCPPGWKADYEPTIHTFYQKRGVSVIYDVGVMKNIDADKKSQIPYTYTWLNAKGLDTHEGINTIIAFCVPPDYHNGN